MRRPGSHSKLAITCAAAAFACVLAAPAAWASGWAVGPITAKSGGKSGFCSMKGSYPGGQTVVFARDVGGSNSIAVDLGKQALEAGKKYQVTLAVGPMTREVAAVASGKSILLIGMGYDYGFYDMLAAGQDMRLTALEQDHVFSLKGTRDALRELDVCTAELALKEKHVGPPQRGAVAPPQYRAPGRVPASSVVSVRRVPASGPVSTEASAKVERELDRLRADVRALQAENAAIKAQANARAEEANLAEQSRAILAREQDGKAREELSRAQAALEARNETLQRDLLLLRQNVDQQAGARAALAGEIAAVQDENARLEQALASAQAGAVDTQQIRAEYTALRAENARLRDTLAAMRLEAETEPAAGTPAAGVTGIARGFQPGGKLRSILSSSRVVPEGGLVPRREGETEIYSWHSGQLFGAAERSPRAPSDTFEGLAVSYFEKMKSLCAGDFAFTLEDVRTVNGMDVRTGEMACIGAENGAAAALLFVDDGNSFSVITHEGLPGQADSAISRRDLVAAAVGSVR